MAITVGITGGIGSGKSTICKVFKLLGVPVYEADIKAKELLNKNKIIKEKLINLYGKDIYTLEGTVNRLKLAAIIFNNDIELEKVNKIVHPLVRLDFQEWNRKQVTPYLIHEAAILFESGFYKMMDFTILVSAPVEMRIERVSQRDNISPEQIKARMNKQWPDSKKRELATLEIKNNNRELIIPQIVKIDKELRKNGKIW